MRGFAAHGPVCAWQYGNISGCHSKSTPLHYLVWRWTDAGEHESNENIRSSMCSLLLLRWLACLQLLLGNEFCSGGGRSQKRLSGWRPWCRRGRFCRAGAQRLENRIANGVRAQIPGGCGRAPSVALRSRCGPAALRAVRMSRGVLCVERGRQ